MVWLGILAVAVVLATLSLRQPRTPEKAAGRWLLGAALLALVALLTLRFAPRLLPFVAAVPLWLVWQRRGPQSTGQPGAEAAWGRASVMQREQALRVLGLEPGATRDEIQDAHRRLIKRLHPDQGGSSGLAEQVNEAKRVLLGQ